MPKQNSTKTSKFIQVPAKQIDCGTRKQIGISALSGQEPVTSISQEHGTSRKFVYAQKAKISAAIDDAFSGKEEDSDALFYIPVTKDWLKQVVLALILICHSSYGGVIEFFRDIFDQRICKGTIFNIIQDALGKAMQVNKAQDLSSIKVGAHDEIFQGRTPVLVGCDVESTYIYLLNQEEHRDSTTWGVHLFELSDQGMKLDYTIGDGGKGLRSGQREAWPDIDCHGDVFHALYDMGKLVRFLGNRAKAALETVEKLEVKIEKARRKLKGNKYSRRLGHARKEAERAVQLENDIYILYAWLKDDILSVIGPDFASRQELMDFIVDELKSREAMHPNRIKSIRKLLEGQGKNILRFAKILDKDLENLAEAHGVNVYYVRQILELQNISPEENLYWERAAYIHSKVGGRFHAIQEKAHRITEKVIRASSIVENLNSRLRAYFFLRKILGNGYLELLQFFLNHRRFMRSNRSERVGKSPKELLTGESQEHWLKILGYKMFRRSGGAYDSSEKKKAA